MTQIAPFGRYRALDANGDPLAGGKLYTYEAGTSTPKATFTDKGGLTANANPVILDSQGYANVWLGQGGYKFSLFNSADVLQWTVDNIDGDVAGGFGAQVISRSSGFAVSVSNRNFVIVCTASLSASLLPASTAGNGFIFSIINTSSGNVTIDPDGSETINGAATLVLQPGSAATVHCNGTAWFANIGEKTSVALTMPTEFTVTGSPVNGQGTLAVTKATQTANLVYAGPTSGSAAAPTFRALGYNDMPARTMVLLTSGTSWPVPANVNRVRYRMVGGGGGGGGVAASNTLGASGGGAGEYVEGYLTVTPGGTLTYGIGAAGTGGAAGFNNGGTGGTTSLGSITALGGSGGQGTNTFGATSAPGLGGTGGVGGDFRAAGAPGGPGIGQSNTGFWGGSGGNSQFGGGGRARISVIDLQGAGFNGVGYGSGGGGGNSTGSAQAGGNGSQGVIILEY